MTQQPNNNPPEENQSSEETESPQASQTQQTKQPFLKALTIRILRGIIARLETTVEKLEAEAEPQEESAQIEETSQAQPSVEELRGWDKRLRQVRDRLPNFISDIIPDWMLTTILVGAGVAVVWGVVAVIPEGLFQQTPQQQQEEEVTQKPEPPIPPPEETTEPEVKSQPEPEKPSTEKPEEKPQAQPEPENEPEPELTPEQNLIASIQEQLSEITTTYAEGLINSIEANFRDGRLIITVDEQWYELSPRRQDKLGKEMLARSRKLDFTKLVLTTPDGNLIARSPVVGENMVILQREKPAPTSR